MKRPLVRARRTRPHSPRLSPAAVRIQPESDVRGSTGSMSPRWRLSRGQWEAPLTFCGTLRRRAATGTTIVTATEDFSSLICALIQGAFSDSADGPTPDLVPAPKKRLESRYPLAVIRVGVAIMRAHRSQARATATILMDLPR